MPRKKGRAFPDNGESNGSNPERDRPVVIGMGGVSWDHLRYTSPGSLADEELGDWGYEPDWAGMKFVQECRDAVRNPIEILSVGPERHLVMLKFPTYYHAEACLRKLHHVGQLRVGLRTGFSEDIKEEGRCFLVGAARGFKQLRVQIND